MADRDFSAEAIARRVLGPPGHFNWTDVSRALVDELAAIAARLPPTPSHRSTPPMGGRPTKLTQVADLDPTPTHVSTKHVRTYEILAVGMLPAGAIQVRLPDGTTPLLAVPPSLDRGNGPHEGDRLIVYQDGYVSWCPAAVYERDYRAIGTEVSAPEERAPALAGLTFGEALEALKAGARICRAGWNGKAMWLALSGPLQGRKIPADSFWSLHNAEFARLNGGSATVLPCITMKTATGEILMGWLASQTDMLAEDWMLVAAGGASVNEPAPLPSPPTEE